MEPQQPSFVRVSHLLDIIDLFSFTLHVLFEDLHHGVVSRGTGEIIGRPLTGGPCVGICLAAQEKLREDFMSCTQPWRM